MSQQDASRATQIPSSGAEQAVATERGRRFERRSIDSPLSIQVETTAIEGMADNLSRVGLMLYTDESLQVTVQIDGFQGGRPLKGRLVRLQRMDESTTGIAIEFDELIDPSDED